MDTNVSDYQIGDIVECIDAENSVADIVAGECYKVVEVSEGFIRIYDEADDLVWTREDRYRVV